MDQTRSATLEHYDLLRVVAALLVFAGHQQALQGLPEPAFLGTMSWGGIGVAIFFSLSGYLVTESWRRDPHLFRYLQRRALRLLPGLAGVVLLTVFVLGPLLTTLPVGDYLRQQQTWEYLLNLVLNIRFALPGVFTELPAAQVMNGSLWTLPMEVGCYVLLALFLLWFPRRWGGAAVWVLALGLWATDVLMPIDVQWVGYATNWRIALHFGVYFFIGAALRLAPPPRFAPVPLAMLAAVLLMFTANSALGYALSSLCVPLCVIGIARISATPSRWLTRHGDLSYGLYLYAFPLQQCVIASGLVAWNAQLGFAVALLATALAALLSWRYIEAPALRWKPRTPSAVRV